MKPLVLGLDLVVAGCATQFKGSAQVTPQVCAAKCSAANMRVGGIVYLGEYSSACVCEVPGASPSVAVTAATAAGPTAAVALRQRD